MFDRYRIFILLNIVNRGTIIIEYIIKYITAKHGVFEAEVEIIHPVWVIDE